MSVGLLHGLICVDNCSEIALKEAIEELIEIVVIQAQRQDLTVVNQISQGSEANLVTLGAHEADQIQHFFMIITGVGEATLETGVAARSLLNASQTLLMSNNFLGFIDD